jgi:CRP-like cAMP-binding protein/DNA-binding transcriptional LysR family regulator
MTAIPSPGRSRSVSDYAVQAIPFGAEPPLETDIYVERGLLRQELRAEPDGPLEFAGPGEILYCDPRSPVIVTAASNSVLIRKLPAGAARRIILGKPAMPGAPKRGVISRGGLTAARTERYRATRPTTVVRARLARLLLDLSFDSTSEPHTLDVVATQADLARAIGACRASVENSLRELRARGVITTGHRSYTILDRNGLVLAAEGVLPRRGSGIVRLGGHGVLPPLFAARLRNALDLPEGSIEVESGNPTRPLRLIETGRIDFSTLEFYHDLPMRVPDTVRARLLVVEPVFVALPEGHPLGMLDAVPLGYLADLDWAVDPPSETNEQLALQRACAAIGFSPRIRHHAAEVPTARELVRAGAVTLAHPASRQGDGVTVRPIAGDPLLNHVLLAWNPTGPLAGNVDVAYRCAAEAYLSFMRRSELYKRWWEQHPESHIDLDAALEQ